MAKHLGYELSNYSFIPSVGATNCINICTILYGWGCPFFAVFDYDTEGVTNGGEVLRKEFLFEFEKQYCYIKFVTQKDVDSHSYKELPYEIEDLVTKDELEKFARIKGIGENISKTLKAKLFSNAVEEGYELGAQCKENFKNLLDRITKTYQ